MRGLPPSFSVSRLAALLVLLAAALIVPSPTADPASAAEDHETDDQLIADIWSYARETDRGFIHVLRWMRVLQTFGALEGMSAAEAQVNAERYKAARWDPVAKELRKLEGASGNYEPDRQVDSNVWFYASDIQHGFAHVHRWFRVLSSFGAVEEMTAAEAQAYADRGWQRWVPVAAELAEREAPAAEPEPEPEPQPNRAPQVHTQAANYANFLASGLAPRGVLVSKPFAGIFSDPDGDQLTYDVAISGGDPALVDELVLTLDTEVRARRPESDASPIGVYDRVWFTAEAEGDWKAMQPPPPDRPLVTVILTATDPGGLSVSVEGGFSIGWQSYPEVVNAVAARQAITLTFDLPLGDPPAPEQFTVRAVNADGAEATVGVAGVTANGRTMNLTLASELAPGQTVTLDYGYNQFVDTALVRAGGSHAAPGFTGLAVDTSNLAQPGPIENFTLLAEPGETTLLASWDPQEHVTSYRLRWRLSGAEFSEDNATSATGSAEFVPVSAFGHWQVGIQACRDDRCGPESFESVDVVGAAHLRVERAVDDDGNVRPRTIVAEWDPVDDASSYVLRWERPGATPTPRPAAQPEPDLGSRQALVFDDSPPPAVRGNNGQPNIRQVTIPADQTNTEINLPDDGAWEFKLDAQNEDDELLATDKSILNQLAGQPDSTAPRVLSGHIDGGRIVLLFSEPLQEDVVRAHWDVKVRPAAGCRCLTGGIYEAPTEVVGTRVTVDLRGQIGAVEGLVAYVSYWVNPGDLRLRDLANNVVETPYVSYDGSTATYSISLQNITGRPRILPVRIANWSQPSGVAISSSPSTGRLYRTGDLVAVTLIFSERVNVDITGGTPRIKIDLDPADGGERWADYVSGNRSRLLKFAYTVVDGDFSNGVAVLADTLELNGGAIRSTSAIVEEHARLGHGGLDHDPRHQVRPPSGADPVMVSASVNGATLTLKFNEPLDDTATLANSAFTVKKTLRDGSEQTLSLSGSPVIDAKEVTLTLASAVLDSDVGVKLSYTKPTSGTNNSLVDLGGAEVADFSDEWVVNALDTTKPRLVRGEIETLGNQEVELTLEFSEPMDEHAWGKGDYYRLSLAWTPQQGGWEFMVKPSAVSISGNTVSVIYTTSIKGQRPIRDQFTHVRYWLEEKSSDDRLQDISGNPVYTPVRRSANFWSTHAVVLDNLTQ